MNHSTLTLTRRIAIFLVGFSLAVLSACGNPPITKSGNHDSTKSEPNPPVPSPQGTQIQSEPIPLEPSTEQGKKIVSSYTGSYALLIGESQYTNGWSKLTAIPYELQQVEELLTAKGFHVEKSLNLNAKQLHDRFETFINDYGFDDENHRLLFFYSGHGHTRTDAWGKQKGYLVPTDAPDPTDDEKGFLQKALDMNQILTWARRIEAKHALFLFDSCFSGTVFMVKDQLKPRQISEMAKLPVRQFITAGSADERVPAKSVFTPAFVDALRYGLGDLYKDGYVTGEELGLYLKNKVQEYTNQTPQYGKIKDYDLDRGDFIFKVDTNPTSPPPSPEAVPVSQEAAPVFSTHSLSRYTDNGDGTVTDNRTGLIWLKNANCFKWVGWKEAKKQVENLDQTQCGLRDGSMPNTWRLPTQAEWDAMKTDITEGAFENVQTDGYWLSDKKTVVLEQSPGKTEIQIEYICTSGNPDYCYVWPVRGGQ